MKTGSQKLGANSNCLAKNGTLYVGMTRKRILVWHNYPLCMLDCKLLPVRILKNVRSEIAAKVSQGVTVENIRNGCMINL